MAQATLVERWWAW